ncbi:Inosine triphosphate pyrophosphatase [Colletotrichum trifolii]|uniref:Inosine triphosphate pyrophosphatase n=1 Tax=Colletotrichum trifolii TaxID=5466 RepID=A0A4R8PZ86_COLTR|nr:Inosine triphosphate pyrophosphatase [Colletotrichum trifolii]
MNMASVTTVNFITGNANKLREVKAILEPTIKVQSKAVDLEEVQGSVEEVTLAKCRKAAETVGALSIFYASSNTHANFAFNRYKALS